MEYCYVVLLTYLAVDCFFAQKDAFLHHIFGILLNSTIFTCGITNKEDIIALSRPFVKTEVSTIFLILKMAMEEKAPEIIKKNPIVKTLYNIINAAFVVTFVKFRVFDLYFDVIKNQEYHNTIGQYYHDNTGQYCFLKEAQFYVGMIALYGINIYWFALICKKMYKQIVIANFPQINTAKFAECLLPWTMFLSVIPYFKSVTHKYDFAGVTLSTFASNLYHGRKRDILNLHNEVYITNNIMVNGLKEMEKDASIEFFFNSCAMHLKSVLSLISMGSDRGNTSAIIHFVFFIGSHIYSLQPIQIVSTDTKYMKVLNACIIIPTLYDLFHIISLTDDRTIQTRIAFTIIAIGIFMKIKPLRELNQLAIHFLMILQTWNVASAVMNVNK